MVLRHPSAKTPASILARTLSCCQVTAARKVVAFHKKKKVWKENSQRICRSAMVMRSSTVTLIETMSNCFDTCEMNSSHFRKTNPYRTAQRCGITTMTSRLRDGLAGGQRAAHVSETQSALSESHRLFRLRNFMSHPALLRKSKAAMQKSCVHIAGFLAQKLWRQLTECQETKIMNSRVKKERYRSCAGSYWRAQSLSACGGRAAVSTPRPLAACLGPRLPARQEPRRPPAPGARTLVAQPPAPGWRGGLLGPPDLQLGNTNMKGK